MTLPDGTPLIESADVVATAPLSKPSLTAVAADGAAWTVVSMGVARVLTLASQLALTRLLIPDVMGVATLATSVLSIASFLGTLSLTQFLIARQRRVRRYADAAFWLSIALGCIGALLLAAVAPFAATFYHDRRLVGLLFFCAATFPISAAGVVPLALAQIELRFKLLAALQAIAMAAQVVASVAAAALGAGAYSIFIGFSAAALTRLVVVCWSMRLRFSLHRRALRLGRVILAHTSGWIVGVGVLINVLGQGDYATMGFFFNKTDIGYYYFAYIIAQQVVSLLGTSMGSVLYPAIATLAGHRERQVSAVMRAVRMLTLVGAPGGLLMVFLLPVVIHAFGSKYLPAVPIAQVMAAGAVGVLVNGPAIALVNAQERFRLYFFSTLLQTALFLPLVLLGCLTHHVLGVATAVSVYFWIGGPVALLLAVDGYRIRFKTVRDVMAAIGTPDGVVAAGDSGRLGGLFPIACRHVVQERPVAVVGVGRCICADRDSDTLADDADGVHRIAGDGPRRVQPASAAPAGRRYYRPDGPLLFALLSRQLD